jgi:hypothetical protein
MFGDNLCADDRIINKHMIHIKDEQTVWNPIVSNNGMCISAYQNFIHLKSSVNNWFI